MQIFLPRGRGRHGPLAPVENFTGDPRARRIASGHPPAAALDHSSSVIPASSLTSRHWLSEPDIRAGANRIMAAGRRSPAQRGTDRDSRDFSYSYPSKTTSPVEQRRR